MKTDLSLVEAPYDPDTAKLVIFATNIVGVGHITAETVDLFIARLLMYGQLIDPLPLTEENIRAFIGLYTDVPFMSEELWLCKMQRVYWEHLHLPVPLKLYPIPGDVILVSGGLPNQWRFGRNIKASEMAAAGCKDMPFAHMYIVYRTYVGTEFVVAETETRLYRELTDDEMEVFHKAKL